MSISDLVRTEYRMTALHFGTLVRVGLHYGLTEAIAYDLNATLSPAYRYELKAILKYGEDKGVRFSTGSRHSEGVKPSGVYNE